MLPNLAALNLNELTTDGVKRKCPEPDPFKFGDVCAICQGKLKDRRCLTDKVLDGSLGCKELFTLSCEHTFHTACIFHYVVTTKRDKCPTCNKLISACDRHRLRSKMNNRPGSPTSACDGEEGEEGEEGEGEEEGEEEEGEEGEEGMVRVNSTHLKLHKLLGISKLILPQLSFIILPITANHSSSKEELRKEEGDDAERS